MTRVLVTLDPTADQAGVVAQLSALGAPVQAPAPELPDVAIAEVAPDGVDGWITAATVVPGVLAAEPDAWRFSDVPEQTFGVDRPGIVPE